MKEAALDSGSESDVAVEEDEVENATDFRQIAE
jgi:hypothetical protein